jgi:hypothetical protein
MNPRERILAMAVLGVVILVGLGFLFHQFVFAGLQQRDAEITSLKASIASKQADLASKQRWMNQKLKDKPRLAYWKQLSLPVNTELSRKDHQKYLSELKRRYENYLGEALDESGFSPGHRISSKVIEPATKAPAGKAAVYTAITFTVEDAHADLAGLVKFMERFYRTSLLHHIKSLSVLRPQTARPNQRPGELDIKLTIEALLVTGAEDRAQLLPEPDRRAAVLDAVAALRGGPGGLGLVPWASGPSGPLGPGVLAVPPRQYAAIARRNVFFNQPAAPVERPAEEVQVTQFVYLTDITHTEKGAEAFLYDRYNNRRIRLRASAGFNTFRLRDSQGETLVQGKVLTIEDRDLTFQVDEAKYTIHVGQSLKEAMEKPLREQKE